ncbi:MAG TPA: MBL fold metallo-hydrolase [Gemmataceae bacterium]|nr:MBL fold metallo-hydrolase [Gemmataceae bacterium]
MIHRQPEMIRTTLCLLVMAAAGLRAAAGPEEPPPPVRIGGPPVRSLVPAPLRQGTVLPPQSVSALDLSDDGRFVAVGTMAFRHDRNFWLLSAETGAAAWGRYVETWAPAQVRALAEGQGFAVGLTYGPVTSVGSTVGLFRNEKDAVAYVYDWPLVGGRGWLRYGDGDWRTGWPASVPADLFVRAAGTVFASADANNGRSVFQYDGAAPKSLNVNRPFRLAASADGKVLAFGYAVHDFRGVESKVTHRFFDAAPPGLVAVRGTSAAASGKDQWVVGPAAGVAPPPKPPEPSADFTALAEDFNLEPLALVPFRIPLSVAVNDGGARVAVAEYGGHSRVGRERILPRWSPRDPIAFCPRQRGRLRVLAAPGRELADVAFPADGWFDVHLDRAGETVWCVPASWFARGLAGCPWLPADEVAHNVFVYDVARKSWKAPWRFPDAVSDFAVLPDRSRALVSCWDGGLYVLDRDGGLVARVRVDGPARIRWSADGTFAVAGTQDGTVIRVSAEGKEVWRTKLPTAEAARPGKGFGPVFKDVPVYSVGRVGPEHAYVGDIWLIKTAAGGILVDTGGVSAQAATRERIRAAGLDPKDVRYVLLSHSHGDHAGAAYLWRAAGAKVVAPASAAFAVTGVMPTWSDYNLWVPCPIDEPLRLKRAGDEAEVTLCGVKVKAIFAPGHSPDSVVYAMELGGRRVIFTGDIGFDDRRAGMPLGSNILHRCWGERDNAARVIRVMESQILPLKPEVAFTGHAAYPDAGAAWGRILEASRAALQGGKDVEKVK